MFRNARILLLPVLFASYASAQNNGTITGTVLDEAGRPLPDAHVHVELAGKPRQLFGLYREVYTDSHGRFEDQQLEPGTYNVYAYKETDGYPDRSSWMMYKDGSKPETVTLSSNKTTADVTVHMGPKLGRVASVHVTDATTGRPVTVTDPTSGKALQAASVMLIRYDLKNSQGEPASLGGSLANILLPIDIPVTFIVSAPGYADWYYPGTPDPAKAQPIRLKSGEEISIDVALQPLPAK